MYFPAQIHNFRKTVIGDNIIALSIDKAFSKDIVEIMEIDPGTQVMVTMEVVTDKEPEQNTDVLEKFRKKMHLKIREVAAIKHSPEERVKNELKVQLKRHKLIETSTTELTIKGYVAACAILDEWLK